MERQTQPLLPTNPTKGSRPVVITIICILGFIGVAAIVLMALLALTGGASSDIGLGLPLTWAGILLLAMSLVQLWPLLGMWNMKKYGVIAYAVLFVIGQLSVIINGRMNWWSFVVGLAVIAVGFSYYNQMD
jgi:hypothetical protein